MDISTLSVNVRYRPVRIGFCIQQGSLDDLDRAIRLKHTFWGGRFNPLIPVGSNDDENKLAKALTNVFQVDVLYPVSAGAAADAFIDGFPHLPWPKYERELYVDSLRGKVASFIGKFEIQSTAVSLEDPARATQNIYFRPTPKLRQGVPPDRAPE